MPIRYHAQRKHIVNSLDTLLYQLHTLSFLLAPSLLIYLCRCATQFQFARARELDGRRSLAFWFALVALVNAGGVWTHAAVGSDDTRTVVLDFVGMGRKPSKLQLLLLDVTIMLLQVLLTTIAYETSLALAMPAEIPDPLFPSRSAPPSPGIGAESEPFLPSTPSPSTPTTSTLVTYPPTPALTPPSPASRVHVPSLPKTFPTPSSNSLPPPMPVIDLTLRHIAHRLIAPVPEPPALAGGGEGGLDADDDALAALRLPLPNTTPVRLLRGLAQARARRLTRERDEARRLRREERAREGDGEIGADGSSGNSSDNGGGGGGGGGGGRSRETRRSMGGRIPGAIDEAEDSD